MHKQVKAEQTVLETTQKDDARRLEYLLKKHQSKLGDEAFGRRDLRAAEQWFTQALGATPHSKELLSRLAACASAATPPAPHAAAADQPGADAG